MDQTLSDPSVSDPSDPGGAATRPGGAALAAEFAALRDHVGRAILGQANLIERLLIALLAVTKKADEAGPENYGRFIERAAADPLARRVKIADLKDNLDVTRLSAIGPEDAARLERYLLALERLKASG